jgi:hypothetical protein
MQSARAFSGLDLCIFQRDAPVPLLHILEQIRRGDGDGGPPGDGPWQNGR